MIKIWKKAGCIFACCLSLSLLLRAETPQTVAQAVLDKLYATNGNYTFKKPSLRISNENKKVAAYSPWKNTITLDEKAYRICQSFGRDSLAALAFILGHELVHAYQTEIRGQSVRTNFLAYNHYYKADIRLEKVADIQGIFNAYLAGYGVLNTMPDVMERIYREYDLIGKTLPGYPPLDQRKSGCREVLTIVENLRDVFESCTYLLAIGQNGLACTGYEYILQYYQGVEIYNNLGIAYTLNARQFWNPQTDKFIYPLEADWYTKLSNALARGQQPIDPTLEPLRTAFLDKAKGYFQKAAQMNPQYLPAHINTVCALNMMGRPVQALKYAEIHLLNTINGKKKRRNQETEMAEIALGITYALQPGGARVAEASAIFQRLNNSNYVLSALYAQQNLQILRGENNTANQLSEIPLPDALVQVASQIQLGRTADLERIPMDENAEISFARKRGADSSTLVFSNSQGNLISLMRFRNRQLAGSAILAPQDDLSNAAYRNIVGGKDGFLLTSARDQVVLKVDQKGRVLEMVKYVEHGR